MMKERKNDKEKITIKFLHPNNNKYMVNDERVRKNHK